MQQSGMAILWDCCTVVLLTLTVAYLYGKIEHVLMLLDSIKQIELTQLFDFFGQERDASASVGIVVQGGTVVGHMCSRMSTQVHSSTVLWSDSARSSALYVYNSCPELQGPSKCPMAGSLALR